MNSAGNGGAFAIVADNASKLFLDGAVVAFHQLALAVRDKEILCIVGPSGCGKTTLLRAIAGLTDIDGGTLSVNGKPVAGAPEGVAMVFQHFGLLPWKTVYDNAWRWPARRRPASRSA
jgi:NitT/TauT family transport system ATP-binding protein